MRQAASAIVPAILLVVPLAGEAVSVRPLALLLGVIAAAIPAASFLFHHAWKAIFPAYRNWATRSGQNEQEIVRLRARITGIFASYRERSKGEEFKKAYALVGKSVTQLEEALAVEQPGSVGRPRRPAWLR